MVGFVLDCAGEQAAAAKFEGLAFPIQGLDVNHIGPGDFGENLRETQAALRADTGWPTGMISGLRSTSGMNSATSAGWPFEFERGGAVGNAPHVKDGQLQRQADLLRGQADAFVGVHGLEHVGNQFLDAPA